MNRGIHQYTNTVLSLIHEDYQNLQIGGIILNQLRIYCSLVTQDQMPIESLHG
jgi:hypothetical protein